MITQHNFIRDGFNTGLAQHNITPQTPLRQQGFGGHFKDAPPPYIKEEDEDNKIERKKKPEPKKKKKRKKGKKTKN